MGAHIQNHDQHLSQLSLSEWNCFFKTGLDQARLHGAFLAHWAFTLITCVHVNVVQYNCLFQRPSVYLQSCSTFLFYSQLNSSFAPQLLNWEEFGWESFKADSLLRFRAAVLPGLSLPSGGGGTHAVTHEVDPVLIASSN